MTGGAPATQTRRAARPGGRSERVRLAVVRATLEELTEHGYVELSLPRIAERAGVALSTVHRRWAGKAGLAAEAASHLVAELPPVEDGPSARAELRALAMQVVASLREPSMLAVLRAFMLLPREDVVALQAAHRELGERIMRPVVERGWARGDLPPGTDPARLAERLVAGIWFRSFVTGLPLDERAIDAFVADALSATWAAAGGEATSGPGAAR